MRRTPLESVEDLKVAEKIGSGRTSEVYLARSNSNKAFAMKKYHMRSGTTSKITVNTEPIPASIITAVSASASAAAEAQILFDLGNHPRIPRVYLTDTEHIVMELSENGEIFDFISHGGQYLNEQLGLFYLIQLIDVISFVHENGYAHRDIKPENLLLDGEFNIKLADFGLSCSHNETEDDIYGIDSIAVGTAGYMAPELIRLAELNERGIYSGTKVDVFSLGVVLFSIVNGFPPYLKQASLSDPYYKFFAEKRTQVYWSSLQRKFGKLFSPDFMSLINGMLAYNPEERFTLEQVKSHAWVKRTTPLTSDQLVSSMMSIKENIIRFQRH